MTKRWKLLQTRRTVAPHYRKDPTGLVGGNISVTFWLAAKTNSVRDAARRLMTQPVSKRHYLSAAEIASQFGPDPDAISAVKRFAQKYGLSEIDSNNGPRQITVSVPAAQVTELFGTQLAVYKSRKDHRSYRGRVRAISLPREDFTKEEIENIAGVFGLDNRPQARHFASPVAEADLAKNPWSNGNGAQAVAAQPAAAAASGINAPQLPAVPAQFPPTPYGFPVSLAPVTTATPRVSQNPTGAGQQVGVIGFGGTLPSNFFSQMGSPGQIVVATPQKITQPDPTFSNESQIDVEIVNACAPGAQITLFAFDETEQGWTTGLSGILQSNSVPSVLSISWGWPEVGEGTAAKLQWTQAAIDAVEDLFAALVLRGVTIVVSSGDLGSLVHYPGSSEFVLSCGGTLDPQVPANEAVWQSQQNASGGGVSAFIAKPNWQGSAIQCKGPGNVPQPSQMRCLPDVAAWAQFSSGLLPGSTSGIQPVNGTSIAAPQWSALMALANEALANAGMPSASHLNAYLYDPSTNLQKSLNDIVNGGNDIGSGLSYIAGPDWDACTGWGTPHVLQFINALVACSARSPAIPSQS
jgi:kumamolisin